MKRALREKDWTRACALLSKLTQQVQGQPQQELNRIVTDWEDSGVLGALSTALVDNDVETRRAAHAAIRASPGTANVLLEYLTGRKQLPLPYYQTHLITWCSNAEALCVRFARLLEASSSDSESSSKAGNQGSEQWALQCWGARVISYLACKDFYHAGARRIVLATEHFPKLALGWEKDVAWGSPVECRERLLTKLWDEVAHSRQARMHIVELAVQGVILGTWREQEQMHDWVREWLQEEEDARALLLVAQWRFWRLRAKRHDLEMWEEEDLKDLTGDAHAALRALFLLLVKKQEAPQAAALRAEGIKCLLALPMWPALAAELTDEVLWGVLSVWRTSKELGPEEQEKHALLLFESGERESRSKGAVRTRESQSVALMIQAAKTRASAALFLANWYKAKKVLESQGDETEFSWRFYLHKAATMGSPKAQFLLSGEKFEQRAYIQSAMWAHNAAIQGYPPALRAMIQRHKRETPFQTALSAAVGPDTDLALSFQQVLARRSKSTPIEQLAYCQSLVDRLYPGDAEAAYPFLLARLADAKESNEEETEIHVAHRLMAVVLYEIAAAKTQQQEPGLFGKLSQEVEEVFERGLASFDRGNVDEQKQFFRRLEERPAEHRRVAAWMAIGVRRHRSSDFGPSSNPRWGTHVRELFDCWSERATDKELRADIMASEAWVLHSLDEDLEADLKMTEAYELCPSRIGLSALRFLLAFSTPEVEPLVQRWAEADQWEWDHEAPESNKALLASLLCELLRQCPGELLVLRSVWARLGCCEALRPHTKTSLERAQMLHCLFFAVEFDLDEEDEKQQQNLEGDCVEERMTLAYKEVIDDEEENVEQRAIAAYNLGVHIEARGPEKQKGRSLLCQAAWWGSFRAKGALSPEHPGQAQQQQQQQQSEEAKVKEEQQQKLGRARVLYGVPRSMREPTEKQRQALQRSLAADLALAAAWRAGQDCKVCFSNKSDGRVWPCGHVFCVSCTTRLKVCPYCKRDKDEPAKLPDEIYF